MPIDKFIALAFITLTAIAATHPMTAALEIRKIELYILHEASDTRSWGLPVIFPGGISISSGAHRTGARRLRPGGPEQE